MKLLVPLSILLLVLMLGCKRTDDDAPDPGLSGAPPVAGAGRPAKPPAPQSSDSLPSARQAEQGSGTCADFARHWVTLGEDADDAVATMLTSACLEAGDLSRHQDEVRCAMAAKTREAASRCGVRPMIDSWFAVAD